MTPEGLDLPLAFTRAWIGALGLVVGSFLNVVVHRLPRGLSIVHPRSRCPGCGRPISAVENVPVLSWLMLRGRCAGCRSPISWRYPAVELLTAGLFVAAHESFGFTPALAVALVFASAVLALVFIDAEHMLLPDSITLPLAVAGLALSFVSPLTSPSAALLGVLLAWAVLEGMNLAYKLLRGRDGFGGGDTKMMMMVGAFLGWQMVVFTLIGGAFLGVLVGIPVMAWRTRRRPPEPDATAATHATHATHATDTTDTTDEAGPAMPHVGIPGPDAGPSGPSVAPLEPVAAGGGTDSEPAPRLADLLPRNLDEALPLAVLPACAVAWLEGGRPERALAGLLAGIAVAGIVHLALRSSGRTSPASRIAILAGALAGLPMRTLPLAAGAALVAGLLLLYRPALVAAREAPEPAGEPGPDQLPASLMQAELPFGVFLGVAALVAMLWGEPVMDWYFALNARIFGMPP